MPLSPLFEEGVATDISYINVRDHPRGQAHREYAEQLWQRFAHLADSHFQSQAKVHFHPRFWEMELQGQTTLYRGRSNCSGALPAVVKSDSSARASLLCRVFDMELNHNFLSPSLEK